MTTATVERSSSFIKPRILKTPPASVGSRLTPKAVSFLERAGIWLDAWQKYCLSLLLAAEADGKWAATEAGLLVARQNGKSEILIAYDLLHLFFFRPKPGKTKTIVHSSHEVKTNLESFEKLEGVLLDPRNAWLYKQVQRIYRGNGSMRVLLKKRYGQRRGDSIKFVARSKNSGRGFSGDIVVFDEAQEFSAKAYRAISYILTTIKHRQEVFVGTVPEDGVNDSEVWEALRDRGRNPIGNDRTLWMEYSPEGSDDPELVEELDFTDERHLEAANPAIDIRVFREACRDEYDRDTSVNKEGYGRERLCIWPDAPAEEAASYNDFDLKKWADGTVATRMTDLGVLGVTIGRGGGYSSIGGAQRLPDGRVLVQHLDTRPGTLWVADRLKELRDQLGVQLIVLDEKNAATILSDLDRAQILTMKMNMSEVAAAFDIFNELNEAGMLRHPAQEELTIAIKNAAVRVMSKPANLRTWEQGDPTEPSSPVQAITLAVWALKKFEATPVKKNAVRGYGG